MTRRPSVTLADLEAKILRLNIAKGRPVTPYGKDADGKWVSMVGNYHLAQAYGGVCLHEMAEGGGTNDVLHIGYATKRECMEALNKFFVG